MMFSDDFGIECRTRSFTTDHLTGGVATFTGGGMSEKSVPLVTSQKRVSEFQRTKQVKYSIVQVSWEISELYQAHQSRFLEIIFSHI